MPLKNLIEHPILFSHPEKDTGSFIFDFDIAGEEKGFCFRSKHLFGFPLPKISNHLSD